MTRLFDETGFKKPTYPELLLDIQDEARSLYGEDVNLSSNTPLGKFCELLAFRQYELTEEIEYLYNSKSIFKSSGQALVDNLSDKLLYPRPTTKASGMLEVTTSGRVVLKRGFLFRGGNIGGTYQVLREVVINNEGKHLIPVESTEFGDGGNAMPRSINVIVTPTRNLDSVTNPEAFVNGQDKETDEELKDRYERSRAISGSRRIEAIEANILQRVDGIKNVRVLENDTMDEVGGIPPKSIHTIYDGGDGKEVARIVYEKKAAGIQAYGTDEYSFSNDKGIVNVIGVTKASKKDIWIKVTITVGDMYDVDRGEKEINKAIYKYIGGYYDGVEYKGLSMGSKIYATQAESAINCSTDGILDLKVEFSLDGESYSRTNIESETFESFNIQEVEVVANE